MLTLKSPVNPGKSAQLCLRGVRLVEPARRSPLRLGSSTQTMTERTLMWIVLTVIFSLAAALIAVELRAFGLI